MTETRGANISYFRVGTDGKQYRVCADCGAQIHEGWICDRCAKLLEQTTRIAALELENIALRTALREWSELAVLLAAGSDLSAHMLAGKSELLERTAKLLEEKP